ncbi:MAG: DUF2330 domain-containing protein [Myxococcota bacterium]
MRIWMGALAATLAVVLPARDALACGGFFCSRSPVDQSAEHILFVMGPGTTTMVVQIAYSGGDADFSWVLPLGAVPDAESLEVFPQLALTSLAANTGPVFMMPQECWYWGAEDAATGGNPPPNAGGTRNDDVTVHVREEVGPYDVAVVESQDSSALVNWLRTNGYRITEVMEPYVDIYTAEGMKFLALKLLPDADVSQIQPLKLTLPGEAPMIPVRLTAIAAEPEMGILATIVGEQRYESANWPSLSIRDDEITYDPYNVWGANGTNWTALVARKVDEAGGRGFVTEFAGATQPFLDQVRNSPVNNTDQEAARNALISVLEGRPYLTRLYTRLSPEEMSTDPIFRRSELGDVDRVHQLSRIVDGVDMCPANTPVQPDPCAFVTCGAGGMCRTDAEGRTGCACLAEATARPMTTSTGTGTVVCQDARMSFVNPGDRDDATGELIADPCLTTSCGEHGRCVAVNLTPTCSCDRGYIAVNGEGGARCVAPSSPIPPEFYARTLPEPAHPGRNGVEPRPSRRIDAGCACAVPNAELPAGFLALVVGLGLLRARRRGAVALVAAVMSGCGTETPAPTVEIGTGESRYESLSDGQDVELVRGAQGGYHMWMSLRSQGLDPEKVWLDVETRVNGDKSTSSTVTRLTSQDDNDVLVGWPLIIAEPERVDGQLMEVHVTLTDEQGDAADASISVRPHMPVAS